MKNTKASMLTFLISAFWHGINPCYYVGFLIMNLVGQMEKYVFKNQNIRFYPSFLNIFIMDYGHCIFKSF